MNDLVKLTSEDFDKLRALKSRKNVLGETLTAAMDSHAQLLTLVIQDEAAWWDEMAKRYGLDLAFTNYVATDEGPDGPRIVRKPK